jgi:arylsulfatase A
VNRRRFLTTAAAGSVSAIATRAASTRPPNIVIIYGDDLGSGDPSCYGSRINTPNIDQMASQGVIFQHCVSGGAVCSPARAALLTGRYGARMGITDVLFPTDTIGIPSTETTIAEVLKPAGYKTMCVGKWHVGSQTQYLPTNRGFDAYYGIPYSHDMTPSILLQNTTIIEEPVVLDTLTQRYAQQAVNFIHQAGNSPFFLYLAHNAPHLPLFCSSGFSGKSNLGMYGDVITEVDWSVGQVLGALQAAGVDQNTLVIFSSDHGPWFNGSPGMLRGRKAETWEGGMRVPLIARFPGQIPAGNTVSSLTTIMDILPTISAIAGAPLPARPHTARAPSPWDGVNIWPVMTGQQEAVPRGATLYFNSANLQCARLGRWKLHLSRYNTYPWTPLPPEGMINLPLVNPELYDVLNDPGESYECSAKNPQVVAEIRRAVYQMLGTFPQEVQNAWNNTFAQKAQAVPAGELPVLAQ